MFYYNVFEILRECYCIWFDCNFSFRIRKHQNLWVCNKQWHIFHINSFNYWFLLIPINLYPLIYYFPPIYCLYNLCYCYILLKSFNITTLPFNYLTICFLQRGHYLLGDFTKHSLQKVCPQWIVTGT
jgi:hypothetical protein